MANTGTLHIFNFGTSQWRTVNVPYPDDDLAYSAVVQTGKTFVKIGGTSTDFIPSSNIYKFDEVNYEWIRLPQTLQVSRYGAVAIPLPDDFAAC